MKRNYQLLLLATVILGGSYSCGNAIDENFNVKFPESYSVIYSGKGFNGDIVLDMTIPEDTVVLMYANYGGIVPLKQDVTVTFSVATDLLETYNDLNLTTYQLLPEDCYSLENNQVTILHGKSGSEPMSIRINTAGIPGPGPYLLPVSIIEVSDTSIKVNEKLRSAYFVIRGSYNENPFTTDFDRTDWAVLSCSSFSAIPQEYTPAELMLDGDDQTYWGTEFSPNRVAPPHVTIIDMKKSMTVHGGRIKSRLEKNGNMVNNGQAKIVTISLSNDNEHWTDAGTYSLPFEKENTFFLNYHTSGRYLRFSVDRCYGGANSEFYQAAISELNIF